MGEDSFSLELASASVDLADVAGTLVPVVGKALAHWANRNTRALLAARDEIFRDWVVEEKRATVEHAKRLAEHAEDLEALRLKLEELISDPSFARVRDNYGYEAAREAIDERRRMLAFACAGSINLDLTIAEISRVERIVRELDPDDIHSLRTLTSIVDPPIPPYTSDDLNERRQESKDWKYDLWKTQSDRWELSRSFVPSTQALIASGCLELSALVVDDYETGTGLGVTHSGICVLRVLDLYI
jgi:hypothetical protein